jgi:hypothetical protein
VSVGVPDREVGIAQRASGGGLPSQAGFQSVVVLIGNVAEFRHAGEAGSPLGDTGIDSGRALLVEITEGRRRADGSRIEGVDIDERGELVRFAAHVGQVQGRSLGHFTFEAQVVLISVGGA